VMERTNARFMTVDWFDETPSFAAVDVSFISIRLILPKLYDCLKHQSTAVVLVKPQFEAGRSSVGKNGVVRDACVHESVLKGAVEFAIECGFAVMHIDYSPIRGPKGNIEYLLVLAKGGDESTCGITSDEIQSAVGIVVSNSHAIYNI